MVWKYIRTPWATGGDRSAIPNDTQPDGSVSQTEGFGIDYQLDPGYDPDAKNVPRDIFNEAVYDTQVSVQQLQQDGFPLFIQPSDNGGSAFSYKIGAVCRYANGWAGATEQAYYSLVAANTADPTDQSKWGLVVYGQQFVTGDIMDWSFSTIRSGGWVWMNGNTIGDASSNATGRANADTLSLYTMLWNDYPLAVLKIYTSAGVETTRGANAAADFAAHKALATIDRRERAVFGRGDMGGAASPGRITNAISGISGTSIGATGGTQAVALTGNQTGAHTHSGTTDAAGNHSHTGTTTTDGSHQHQETRFTTDTATPGTAISNNASSFKQTPSSQFMPLTDAAGDHDHDLTTSTNGSHTHAFSTGSAGLGEVHQNMPPAIIGGGWIMKL